jgi:hypothetical protein
MRSREWIIEAQAELDKADLGWGAVLCANCRMAEASHPVRPCKGYVPTPRWAAIMKLVDERIAARKAA